MGTEDVKVTAMNMYKYKERLRFGRVAPVVLRKTPVNLQQTATEDI